MGLQWSHGPFTLNTVPIDHDFCGDFTYESTFKGNPIDTTSAHMQYDTATRAYIFYSEDMSLIGLWYYTLEAHLTDYPVTRTAVEAVKSTMDIIDPCIDPFEFTMPA